jgi:hypothetical protein
VRDDLGRVAIGIDDAGLLWIGGKQYVADSNQYARSGYMWGLTDESGRVVFGIDYAGRIVVNGSQLPTTVDRSKTRSGYSFALTDERGAVAFGIDYAGRVVVNGVLLEDLLDSASGGNIAELEASVEKELNGLDSIVCWGDSMTEGVDPATPYPEILATITGRTVINRGIGGQKSSHIASRSGAAPVLLTVSGDEIPASGAVVVTAQSASPISWRGSQTLDGYLSGIRGTLTRIYNADLSIDNLHFTRSSAGTAKPIDPETLFIPDTDTDDKYRVHVIWMGRNNLSDLARIMSDYADMVAYMQAKNKRFLVLPPPNGTGESTGTSGHTLCIAARDALKAAYPKQFVDVRRRMVESYNPSIPQDVIDYANDIPPTSLRLDTIHYTTAGNTLVAQWVADEINNRSW